MIDNVRKEKNGVRTFDLVLTLLVTVIGALFFLCITRSMGGVSLGSPWLSVMFCAVVFETGLILFAITVGKKKLIAPIVVIAFLPSIIFLPVVWHILIVTVAVLITTRGLYVMRRTLFNTLKIDISTIVRSGIAYMSFALVIVITSQYYFFVKQDAEVLFDAGNYVKTSNLLIDTMLKSGNVDSISINTMTVNDFVTFIVEKVHKQEPVKNLQINEEDEDMLIRSASQVGVEIEEIVENQASEQMLINISEMIGRDIVGSELIQDVFVEIISTQINNTIERNEFLRKNKVNIFTFAFFIIIFSLASIVRIITGWCTRFVFMLFREFKIVRVGKTPRDAEVIVF